MANRARGCIACIYHHPWEQGVYQVREGSNNKLYEVQVFQQGYKCSCPIGQRQANAESLCSHAMLVRWAATMEIQTKATARPKESATSLLYNEEYKPVSNK